MRLNLLVFSALLLSGFGMTGLKAQDAIPASGGNSKGSGGSVSYTVGQLVSTTEIQASGTLTQGVQQAYEISVITENVEIKGISLSFSVYPNPATDYILLKVENGMLYDLTYSLYDTSGGLIVTDKIGSNSTTIQTGMLAAATYFLKITKTNDTVSKEVKTFKIVKK